MSYQKHLFLPRHLTAIFDLGNICIHGKSKVMQEAGFEPAKALSQQVSSSNQSSTNLSIGQLSAAIDQARRLLHK